MNVNVEKKHIIFGIGNCGRQDDGIGWAFLDLLNKNEFKRTSFEYKYQLQIEDAEQISNYDTVIFVDASKNDLINGYFLMVFVTACKYMIFLQDLATY